MPNAMDVANFFLAVAPEDGQITNLKLQKLCCYAQAVNLAYRGSPLFAEPIQAWTHGPVVPSVYEEFCKYGSDRIPAKCSEDEALSKFSKDESYILQMVWATYGRFTTWALRDQSHWDFPGRFGSKEVITDKAMQKAFVNNYVVKRMRQDNTLKEAGHAMEI